MNPRDGNQGQPTIADIDQDDDLEVLWASQDENLYCIDANTASLEWSFHVGAIMWTNQVIVADINDDDEYEALIWADHNPTSTMNSMIGWIMGEGLNGGIENSMVSKLENAVKALGKSQEKTAQNILNALVNQVEDLRGDEMDDAQADFIHTYAEYVIGMIDSANVFAISSEGEELWRWTLPVEGNIRICQAIGDVDEDGSMDMAIMSNVGIFLLDIGGPIATMTWMKDPADWSTSGDLPPGAMAHHWSSYQMIVDLDGDDSLEILWRAPFPIVTDEDGNLEAYYTNDETSYGRRAENGGWWGDVDGDGESEWLNEITGHNEPGGSTGWINRLYRTQTYSLTAHGEYPAKAAWPEYYHSALPPAEQEAQGLSLVSAYSNSLWFPIDD
jgi:hypothetical protein